MKELFSGLKRSTLARNTFWVLSGNGLRLVIQAAYFVIIARTLGPEEYGAFVAVVALAAILEPFVGLGTSNLLIRNVAHDKGSFCSSWGNGLLVSLLTGSFALVLVCACRFVLPKNIHWTALLLVASANLIFGRITDLCGFAFGALERFKDNAHIGAWSSLSRLLGLIALIAIVRHPSIEEWATVYLIATALTAVASFLSVLKASGKPLIDLSRIWTELREGFYYSVGQSAQTIYNDIDKTMLAKLGDLSATGIYAAAYRIIDVSLVPAMSMRSAAYPGCFRAGKNGMSGSLAYARRLLPKPILLSVLLLVGFLIGAPIISSVLGGEYAHSVEALRWLAILPLIKTIHLFLVDALTGAGYQRLRTVIQALVAGFNVLINLWIIPAYSWRGAAWSSIASDALLACMCAAALTSISRMQKKSPQLMTLEVGTFD